MFYYIFPRVLSALRHCGTKTAKVTAFPIEAHCVIMCDENLQEILSKQIWAKAEKNHALFSFLLHSLFETSNFWSKKISSQLSIRYSEKITYFCNFV